MKQLRKAKWFPALKKPRFARTGKIADNLIETPYGYHIIKLEKKGEGKDPSGQPTETTTFVIS
jgi:hypothetical protein